MSNESLQTCPKCSKGKLRPTGLRDDDRESAPPFKKVGEKTKVRCDYAACGYEQTDVKVYDYFGSK